MKDYKVWVLALALFLVGGALFVYKWQGLGYPLLPDEQTRIWTVEATLKFDAGPAPVPAKVTLYVPALTPGFAILDENFVSRGFGFTTRYVTGGRQVQWAVRRVKGEQTLYYRATIYKDPLQAESDTTPPFPAPPRLREPENIALQQLLGQIQSQSADPASFTVELLKRLANPGTDQNVLLLLGSGTGVTARAATAITVLAAAQIPARLLRGVYLVDREQQARVLPWLEVHDGERWIYFDPATGAQGLPDNFLIWWRGSAPLYTRDGSGKTEVQFSVQRNEVDPVLVAERRANAWQSRIADFSMFSLPIQTQAVYGVLLMIPLGALLVVFLRNIVGVTTFGTFMPVLVALAFRETEVVAGVILFSLVVALGLLFRFFMEHLRLLLVPRLASVLIIVVLLMALISIVGHQLGLDMGLSVGLFPMVILTMTIERMSIVWEERGPTEAIQQGVGSLFVAALCFSVMDIGFFKHLFFVFPELLLWLLAITLLLGRYSGYRLFELVRFKSFADRAPLMFGLAKRLSASGVLGINARNCRYILRHNPRHLYPLVDDKLATKRLAIAAGLPVPELYGVITSHHDVRRLPELVAGHRDFVIKPAHGSGGDGILVVSARVRDGSAYRLVDGTIMDGDDIGHHLSNMLSGQYSLGGHRDIALIEYCVKFDPIFSECAYRGIPDIRVIVFRGYPVMAMLRLPTRRSHGKANLHQGAVGAGLDLATGKTICAVIGNSVVTEHPDTGAVIAGRQIPRWEYLLDFAARCHELTGLGYLGVDIVLDRDLGPMLLELNVRPGLNIQIANRCGLGDRLRAIEARPAGVGVKERVAFSMGPLLQPAAVAI